MSSCKNKVNWFFWSNNYRIQLNTRHSEFQYFIYQPNKHSDNSIASRWQTSRTWFQLILNHILMETREPYPKLTKNSTDFWWLFSHFHFFKTRSDKHYIQWFLLILHNKILPDPRFLIQVFIVHNLTLTKRQLIYS